MEKVENVSAVKIDASNVHYRQLNARLRELVAANTQKIEIRNVFGQRYIGTGLNVAVEIEIFGTPGNDMGVFMDAVRLIVHGNAQDGCGNTMNGGEIIIHGRAGDTVGLSARGGSIFVRDSVGYRAGIHMKEYGDQKPTLVIGGTAQDFLGEYMAGGVLVLLGINLEGDTHKARFIGTGMHGGVIYLRGEVEGHQLGKEVGTSELNENDQQTLTKLVTEFANHFGYNAEDLLRQKFTKLYPKYLRPYGQLYTY
ncbi:MAG: hypothetical protein NTX46_02225 [Chloroflexi bacterium]|nr:hypothetical protein [Chloroflexota bacterium]